MELGGKVWVTKTEIFFIIILTRRCPPVDTLFILTFKSRLRGSQKKRRKNFMISFQILKILYQEKISIKFEKKITQK